MTDGDLPDFDEVMQSDGASIALAHNFLSRSAGLLLGNMMAIHAHFQQAKAPFIANVGQFVDEAERHTFNLLMSSMALRDLSRRVLKVPLIASSDLPAANAEWVKVFTDDVEVAVIGELRDHMAHRGLPPLNMVTTWVKDQSATYRVILQRGPLIRDKKVSSAVRTHLQTLPDDPEFAPLIDRYIRTQWAWLRWFQKGVREHFSAQLSELDATISPWTHAPESGSG
jgi:hypothetical protein